MPDRKPKDEIISQVINIVLCNSIWNPGYSFQDAEDPVVFGGLGKSIDVKLLSQVLRMKLKNNTIETLKLKKCLF